MIFWNNLTNINTCSFTIMFFIYLLISINAGKDFCTKIISIPFTGLAYVLSILNLVLFYKEILIPHIIAMGIVAIVLYFLSRCAGLGGGDTLVIPLLALNDGLLICLFSIFFGCIITTLTTFLCVYIKKKKITATMEAPLLPGITVVYFFILFFGEII